MYFLLGCRDWLLHCWNLKGMEILFFFFIYFTFFPICKNPFCLRTSNHHFPLMTVQLNCQLSKSCLQLLSWQKATAHSYSILFNPESQNLKLFLFFFFHFSMTAWCGWIKCKCIHSWSTYKREGSYSTIMKAVCRDRCAKHCKLSSWLFYTCERNARAVQSHLSFAI